MPSLALFRRRDPWWDVEGKAARRTRRWRRFVSAVAFVTAVVAVGGAAAAWAIELGVAGALGFHVALAIG